MVIALKDMPVWKDPPFQGEVPAGCEVRRTSDARNRWIVVICNKAGKMFSLPYELIIENKFPEFFKERISGL